MTWKRDLRETVWLIRQLAWNPPLVWGDPPDDGYVERMSRGEVWKVFKPNGYYVRFTREADCGCRTRRLTGRRVLTCWPHFEEELEGAD